MSNEASNTQTDAAQEAAAASSEAPVAESSQGDSAAQALAVTQPEPEQDDPEVDGYAVYPSSTESSAVASEPLSLAA